MNKADIVRKVYEKTGVNKDIIGLVFDDAIGAIKEAVESGERVAIAEFIIIYLREKHAFRASSFTKNHGFKGRIVVEGGKVPWVKVSRKWRDQCLKREAKPKQEETDKNQLRIFDDDKGNNTL